jgi:eukaryotic-like serine/threonine-protein kinase
LNRSHAFVAAVIGTVVLAAWIIGPSASAAPVVVGTNWHQGEFDAAHTVHNRYETILAPWNVGRLTLAWSAQVGVGALYASPIVVDGRVYLGGGDGRMHAFDTASGAELWSGPPQQLFFVDSAASAYGLVYANALYKPLRAYDAATGDIKWTAGGACRDMRASPTGAGHVLYMACFTGALVAVDPESGAMLWSAPGGCCVYDQAPVVDGGRVFQMRTNATLTAYDAATGTTLWTDSAFSVGTFAASHGTLYYGDYPDVVAVDEATGAEKWRTPVFVGGQGSPAVADGLVFVVGSGLTALNARTGAVVWTAPAAASTWGPSVANGVVYASSLNGEWDAFDERDGTLLWSVTIGGACGGDCTNAIPVVADGTLYLAGPDQYLRAYRLGP